MSQFNQALNIDVNNKLTSSVYDSNVAAWMQKVQNYVQSSGGVWVPLVLDANGRQQVSVKDSALPTGAATEASLAAVLAKIIAAPATEAKQDALVALIGALNATAVVDPAATSATELALLRGIIKQLQGDGTTGKGAPIQGIGADDSAPVGPPVLTSGRFDTTPTTRHSGDKVTQQMTAQGAAHTTLIVRYLKENTHHNGATVVADGTDIDVAGMTDLGLVLKGTSTSRTWKFYISIDGTTFTPIKGYNFETGGMATSSTGGSDTTPESWSFPVAGAKKFRVRLDAVNGGNGTAISEVAA